MSRDFRSSILALLVVLAVGMMLAAQASHALQTGPAAQDRSAMGAPAAGSPESHLKMLSEKLNLTDDQKARIKPILEDEGQQMKAVRDDTALSDQQRHAKMKGIHESFHDQINAVLTPEQQGKWKQMKQEAMEKHKEMKGEMDHQ